MISLVSPMYSLSYVMYGVENPPLSNPRSCAEYTRRRVVFLAGRPYGVRDETGLQVHFSMGWRGQIMALVAHQKEKRQKDGSRET